MAVEVLALYPELDCHKCDEKLKKERGHYENGILPFWIEDELHYRCPLSFVTDLTWEYVKAYSFYEDRFLPNGVGWNNESRKFTQAMMILKNTYAEFRNKEKPKKIKRR